MLNLNNPFRKNRFSKPKQKILTREEYDALQEQKLEAQRNRTPDDERREFAQKMIQKGALPISSTIWGTGTGKTTAWIYGNRLFSSTGKELRRITPPPPRNSFEIFLDDDNTIPISW